MAQASAASSVLTLPIDLSTIGTCAKEEHGSGLLRDVLDPSVKKYSSDAKTAVATALVPEVMSLSCDTFGTHVVQALIQHSTLRKSAAEELVGHFAELAKDEHGCRVVQKVQMFIEGTCRRQLDDEIAVSIAELSTNPHGNHVVQRSLEHATTEFLLASVGFFSERILELAQDQYGSRVIQRLITRCNELGFFHHFHSELLQISGCAFDLSQHMFGNSVICCMLEKADFKYQQAIVETVSYNLPILAKHQVASKVVEKCISSMASNTQDDERGQEFTRLSQAISALVPELVTNSFGAYIVQTWREALNNSGMPQAKKAINGGKGALDSNDLEKAGLVDRIKALQRRDASREAWSAFADTKQNGIHDPNRHSKQALQEFLSQYEGPHLNATSAPHPGTSIAGVLAPKLAAVPNIVAPPPGAGTSMNIIPPPPGKMTDQQGQNEYWVCSCGFTNVARNEVCGGNGSLGCKLPRGPGLLIQRVVKAAFAQTQAEMSRSDVPPLASGVPPPAASSPVVVAPRVSPAEQAKIEEGFKRELKIEEERRKELEQHNQRLEAIRKQREEREHGKHGANSAEVPDNSLRQGGETLGMAGGAEDPENSLREGGEARRMAGTQRIAGKRRRGKEESKARPQTEDKNNRGVRRLLRRELNQTEDAHIKKKIRRELMTKFAGSRRTNDALVGARSMQGSVVASSCSSQKKAQAIINHLDWQAKATVVLERIGPRAKEQEISFGLQKTLMTGTPADKDAIFEAVFPEVLQTSLDEFGTNVIQLLVARASEEQLHRLANFLLGHVKVLALDKHGHQVLHKLQQLMPSNLQTRLECELGNVFFDILENTNGNRLLVSAVERGSLEFLSVVINLFTERVDTVARTHCGLQIWKPLLKRCTESDIEDIAGPLFQKVGEHLIDLIPDVCGSLVVQYYLKHGRVEDQSRVIAVIRDNLVSFSTARISSDVISSCFSIMKFGNAVEMQNAKKILKQTKPTNTDQIECSRKENLSILTRAIVGETNAADAQLLKLAQDKYGCMVVKALVNNFLVGDEQIVKARLLDVLPELCKPSKCVLTSAASKCVLTAISEKFGTHPAFATILSRKEQASDSSLFGSHSHVRQRPATPPPPPPPPPARSVGKPLSPAPPSAPPPPHLYKEVPPISSALRLPPETDAPSAKPPSPAKPSSAPRPSAKPSSAPSRRDTVKAVSSPNVSQLPKSESQDVARSRSPLKSPLDVMLSDVAKHAQTEKGMRLLKGVLSKSKSSSERLSAITALIPVVVGISCDGNGYQVVQALIEHSSTIQRERIANMLAASFRTIAGNNFGCEVLEKMMGLIHEGSHRSNLEHNFLQAMPDLAISPTGSHLLQKVLEDASPIFLERSLSALLDRTLDLVEHYYGCRIIQILLHKCVEVDMMDVFQPMLDRISECALGLCFHDHGSCVIQSIIGKVELELQQPIVDVVRMNIDDLSREKASSEVVQKCISSLAGDEDDTLRLYEGSMLTREILALAPELILHDNGSNILEHLTNSCVGEDRDLVLKSLTKTLKLGLGDDEQCARISKALDKLREVLRKRVRSTVSSPPARPSKRIRH